MKRGAITFWYAAVNGSDVHYRNNILAMTGICDGSRGSSEEGACPPDLAYDTCNTVRPMESRTLALCLRLPFC